MGKAILRVRGKFFGICLVLLLTVFVEGGSFTLCAAAEAKPQGVASNDDYLLGVGDVLDVSVWDEPDISKTVFVRLDGKISLPLIGDVPAKGVTTELLAKQVRNELSKFVTDPSVTVALAESRSRIYYVLGQIAKPGEYPLNTPITILQAIARAGGLGEWAKKEKIMVIRRVADHDQIIHFNYEEFLEGQSLNENIYVKLGDTIVVP